jgi:hypothetical protein
MGVITVIGDEGVQVLVEFVGGPRDGKRSFAITSTDMEGRPMPPAGFAAEQLTSGRAVSAVPASPAKEEDGRYARDGITPDGEAYTYVWVSASEATLGASPTDPVPDLATRIRRDYARRAMAEGELQDGWNGRLTAMRKAINRRRG